MTYNLLACCNIFSSTELSTALGLSHLPIMQPANILVIKMSSLGDVVHMLPAISDAQRQVPSITIDWVVEEAFQAIPSWHPAVRQAIPIAIRRWRKQWSRTGTWREMQAFRRTLQQRQYDAVIDSQGLLKSGVVARLARGQRFGYDRHSSREPLASWLYDVPLPVARDRHAITRNRLLMAQALGYSIENLPLDYGIAQHPFPAPACVLPPRYVVALHGTSRPAKEWAEAHWHYLLGELAQHGFHALLPWGNSREHERAARLAAANPKVQVLPRCQLGELAAILSRAEGVVGMDTGLMHLAAALDKPGIALYPATQPALTGVLANSTSPNRLLSIGGTATQDTVAITRQLLQLLPN